MIYFFVFPAALAGISLSGYFLSIGDQVAAFSASHVIVLSTPEVDWTRVSIVAAMLTVALVVNVITNIHFPALLGRVPVLGLSVWAVLLLAAPLRRPDWTVMPETFKGTKRAFF